MTYKRALFFIFPSLEGSQEEKKGGGLLPPDFSQKIKVRMGILPGSPNIIAPALFRKIKCSCSLMHAHAVNRILTNLTKNLKNAYFAH